MYFGVMNVGIPEIIIIVLYSLTLGTELTQHGKPREGKHSFWVSLIGCGIMIGLLIWGGFF